MSHDDCAWLPYALLPSQSVGNERPEVVLFRAPAGLSWPDAISRDALETVEVWSIDQVMSLFADHANHWHEQVGRRSHAPTLPQLREWIQSTRALAGRLQFAAGVADTMNLAASRLERTLA